MEKRLFLAVALSFGVVMVWSMFTPKPTQVGLTKEGSTAASFSTSATSGSSPAKDIELSPAKINIEKVPSEPLRLDKFEVEIIPELGTIKKATFFEYANDTISLKKGLFYGDENTKFRKEIKDRDTITFKYSDATKDIIKTVQFHNDLYYIDLKIETINKSDQVLSDRYPLVVGTFDFSNANTDLPYSDITYWSGDKPLHFDGKKDVKVEDIKYAALRNRFFCIVVEPVGSGYGGLISKVGTSESEVSIVRKDNSIPAKGRRLETFKVYLGPQDTNIIAKLNAQWNGLVYYGTFDPISKIIVRILSLIQIVTRNWGVAIILLSVLMYFLLFPLSYKQMRSMKEMQLIQPKVEELKKAYKDNPQKLNKEILELYKAHKVNPMSGCLPLILQIPVFFALYQALIRSTAIKQAHFLWIKDLSLPDRLFLLPSNIPIIGNEINLLPLIMAVGMFVQQKATASAASGVSAEQQKMMQIIFPIMFGFIFYKMPSGLVLYWLINSMLMLAYQLKINKSKS